MRACSSRHLQIDPRKLSIKIFTLPQANYICTLITWAYPKGSPRLKLPFVFCVQSQIAVWALRRMRPCLLSLRMRMIRAHGKKMVDYFKRRPWKETRIL